MTGNQRREETEAATKSRRKFEVIFEHANDAIFIVDIENDSIVDCNPAAAELLEYSREELLSMPASDLHPHNLSEFRDFAEEVFEEGEGWTDDITCYRKTGDIIPAEMSASVIELDGRPHLVNHIRETTSNEQRDWFETLLEHSNDLITVVKSDGTVRYQSTSIDTILGYTPDEIQNEVIFEFIHPDDREKVRNGFEAIINRSSGSAVTRQEYRFRRADGSWAWLESVVSFRPDDQITGYVLNSRDITSRKESRQQAAVLNRTLRHNLRNELNVVLSRAQLLTETDSDQATAHAESIISKVWELHGVAAYSKDLADILESRHGPHQYEVIELLELAVADIEETYPNSTFELDTPAEQHVMATPKLHVAIEHVLENAVEHNDADPPRIETTVTQSEEDGYIDICVTDNGPGIPKNEREVILSGEEQPLKHGSGLGLWIVNWIVTRSGGRLRFEENEPQGSRVTLVLPSGGA